MAIDPINAARLGRIREINHSLDNYASLMSRETRDALEREIEDIRREAREQYAQKPAPSELRLDLMDAYLRAEAEDFDSDEAEDLWARLTVEEKRAFSQQKLLGASLGKG